MKIVLVVTGLGMGGAERQVCDLADEFATLGHEVILISMTGVPVNRPMSNVVEIVSLNMKKTLLGFIYSYVNASQIIKKFKPDVVHSHMIHANIFTRLLRLAIKFPKLICSAHSSNEGGRGRMLAYRLTDGLCDLSTNVSHEAVDISVLRGAMPAHRIVAMQNGIDITRYSYNPASRDRIREELGIASDTLLLLAVGRLTKAKDYPNLLRAFSILPTEFGLAQLVIIGSGEEELVLKQLAKDLDVSSRTHFLGLRRDVGDWMSAADIYVMSSAWEGMPLVLLEAMACQRVVVATDCGGVKEVIGDVGILVPPKDSAALAKGLVQGLELSTEESCARGRLARQRVNECYSLSAQASRWLALYK